VTVQWTVRSGELSLSWIERGGPPVSRPTSSGFGSQLIRAALPGTPRIAYSTEGFEYEVLVPLEDVMET